MAISRLSRMMMVMKLYEHSMTAPMNSVISCSGGTLTTDMSSCPSIAHINASRDSNMLHAEQRGCAFLIRLLISPE